MRPRKFGILLCCLAVLWPTIVMAQRAVPVPVIGVLLPGSKDAYAGYLAAFVQGLKELGRIEGQGFVLDVRWADGQLDQLPVLAADLVERKVDVLLVSSAGAAIAARKATATVPIVQASGGDPVRSGLTASLSHPGGNLTGISNLAEDLSGKSLEQLTLMAPSVRRFGVLFNPANATHQMRLVEAQRAGSALAVEVHAVTASSNTLDQALDKLGHGQAGGLVVLSDGMFLTRRHEIIGRVAKAGLPAIYQIRQFVTDGGLMSYGISIGANYRRAATFVHRILDGAKPADLPIETARTFELVINLKTAKALRLSVPRFLLMRATELIE